MARAELIETCGLRQIPRNAISATAPFAFWGVICCSLYPRVIPQRYNTHARNMITVENFRQALEQLGFVADKSKNSYTKEYDKNQNEPFSLSVDLKNQKFGYPAGMTSERGTTLDFHQNESFVVFECVTRLFDIGYKPQNITLEGKNYEGHNQGWIDILVKNNDGIEYLIIECKTTDEKDSEFEKHWKRTLRDGDQLFRYFNTYSKAQFLCLYTADFVGDVLANKYNVITLQDNDDYLEANTDKISYKSLRESQGSAGDFFNVWKNTYDLDYTSNGVFEKNCEPFNVGKKKVSVADLKEIDSVSMQKKYNEFATILRKYNVSSKENAFDKLVNLFLVKIVDETRNSSELECLWKGAAYDNYYDLQDRLLGLYKDGMKEFFNDEVAYVDKKQIDDSFMFLENATEKDVAKDKILEYFKILKYYNNNPFAFLDVHNKELFFQNAVILKEMVGMIQDIKIKTEEQNQFLGDLFEGFLDQGIKQSEGQFFTPIPIVKFLVASLPLEHIITNSKYFPKAIDYACGSGHFLTEYAQQSKKIYRDKVFEKQHVDETDEQYKIRISNSLKEVYKNIYGIEKEYRLSKVSRVSAFMYGQNEINVFYKDALGNINEIKDNTFSILIANPPYSVKGFLETLSDAEREKFDLYKNNNINVDTNNSIETFFVERAKQLLKKDGIAAIILPSSVLSNSNIYAACREIIFKYFELVAIFESGAGTFGKTGTKTATIFLRRRDTELPIAEHYRNRVDAWFAGNFNSDNTYNDAHLLKKYCEFQKYDIKEYKEFLKGTITESLHKTEMFEMYDKTLDIYSKHGKIDTKGLNNTAKEIRAKARIKVKQKSFVNMTKEERAAFEKKTFYDFVAAIEKEKLYFFLLIFTNQDVLIVKSPEKDAIKKFLGYEWSDTKGSEGIKYINVKVEKNTNDDESVDDTMQQLKGIDSINTPLFNPKDFNDNTKINVLIRKSFLKQNITIPADLTPYVKLVSLVDMLDFSRSTFDKVIKTSVTKKVEVKSKWELVKLGDVAEISRGASPRPIDNFLTESDDGVNWIKIGDVGTDTKYITQTQQKITQEGASKSKKVYPGDFIISNSMSVGRPYILKIEGCIHDGWLLISNLDKSINKDYFYYVLMSSAVQEQFADNARGGVVQNLNTSRVSTISLPLPPLAIQQQIADECGKIDAEYNNAKEQIENCRKEIEGIMQGAKGEMRKLGDVCEVINPSRATIKDVDDETIVSFVEMASVSNDGFIETSQDLKLGDLRKGSYTYFAEDDIIIAKITPCMENGKCAIAKNLTNKIGMGSSEFHVFRTNEKILNKFLFAFLNRQEIRKNAEKSMTGASGHRRVPITFYETLQIPVPPLSEQKKIVAKIEKIEQQIAASKSVMETSPQRKREVLDRLL